MSYQTSDGTYVHTVPLTTAVVASAARTTSSNGSVQETGNTTTLRNLTLNVTAKTGTTPTLAVVVQGSADNSTWYDVGAFTTVSDTAVTAQTKSFPGLDRYLRIKWTIGGSATPGYTFSVGVVGAPELV